jgi:hypothetical protein
MTGMKSAFQTAKKRKQPQAVAARKGGVNWTTAKLWRVERGERVSIVVRVRRRVRGRKLARTEERRKERNG